MSSCPDFQDNPAVMSQYNLEAQPVETATQEVGDE